MSPQRRAISAAASAPKVSVFIAVFNGREYIDRAINSVLQQTHHNTEIILVDDASTDGTAEHVVAAFGAQVKVIRNAANLGPAASRNRAIAAAVGEWLMQLDGDDWIAPRRVEHLLEFAQATGADIVADDQVLVVDGADSPFTTRFIECGLARRPHPNLTLDQFVRRDLGSIKPMIRAELLHRCAALYPEDLRYGEDFVFLYSLLVDGARMALSPSPSYFLRRGATGSLTTKRAALFTQLRKKTGEMIGHAQQRDDADAVAALHARLRRLGLLEQGELARANLRARRLPSIAGIGALLAKSIHVALSKIKLFMMMSTQGHEIRERIRLP